jgi:hypothetical protein
MRRTVAIAALPIALVVGVAALVQLRSNNDRVAVEAGRADRPAASTQATFPTFPSVGEVPGDFVRIGAHRYVMPAGEAGQGKSGWEAADVYLARDADDPAAYQSQRGAVELLVTLLQADVFDAAEVERAVSSHSGALPIQGSGALPLGARTIRSGKAALLAGDGDEWTAVQWHERPGLSVSVSGRNLGEEAVLAIAERVTFPGP